MSIQSEKYHLIQQIIELQDFSLVKKLREFLSKETNTDDWYANLSSDEKNSISKGLQDIENGNVIAHEDVMRSVKEKIASLK